MEKFFDYFDERYRESVLSGPASEDGPVITISRQTGCDAREIAAGIVDRLNLKLNTSKWKWVDKDIIYSIARELNIDTQRIENYYEGIKLSNLSEMIMAFSGGFVSDLRVKKAIRDVVLSICKEGNVVIVGRGSVSIAHGIKDALHVRLVAPFPWRVENVMRKKEMNAETAEKYVIETDAKRNDLIHTFLDKKTANIESLFDISLNRVSFSIQDSADIIVSMYEKKVLRQMAERTKLKSVI
ncbi:MAG TPA: cytidylate kinase-like family protein [Bacteroidales bacterium]|jgi:cytidylate kinase|nr:cytidylate kinase-like family protein [Bacteroidales bacterium]